VAISEPKPIPVESPADGSGDEHQAVLARRGLAYGAGTFISRVLGLGREVLIARDLGTGSSASALVVAQTVPNLARTLVADDVAQGVLVPIFSRTRDKDGAEALASLGLVVACVFTVLMVCIGAAVALLADPVVALIAPGIPPHERARLVAPLLRLFAITLAFGGLGTVGSAYLILQHRYFSAAIAVAASNVPVVLLLVFDPTADVTLIAVSLALGIVIQSLAQRLLGGWVGHQRPSMAALRDRHVWRIVRRIAVLALPVSIALGMANLSGVIDTAYCSLVATGGPAAFDKAFRLALVPYGVIALAIGVASVNAFIGASKRPDLFSSHISSAVRLQFALLLPAGAIVTVYARPLITVFFARGSFNAASVQLTTEAMRGMGIVLPALGLSALGARAWTTRQLPWTPALAGIGGLIGNFALDAALYKPLGLAGIALATAVVHLAVGSGLLIMAVPKKMALLRSVAPMAMWALGIGAIADLPIAIGRLVASGVSTAGQLVMLAIGVALAVPVGLMCPEPEYRVLGRGIVRR